MVAAIAFRNIGAGRIRRFYKLVAINFLRFPV